MTRRTQVLGVVLAFVALPAVIAVAEAVTFEAAHREGHSFISSGIERTYALYVPRSYDASRPTPLVISLHGGALSGAAQQRISRWDRVAERDGFIVVYPSGVRRGPRAWGVGEGPRMRRDVVFIAALIDTLRSQYNIDSTRIYANGLSNGGGMSFVLSCTMSDRIAAVGLVASAQTLPFAWCKDTRPVPMIAIHGTADRAAAYDGGPSWVLRGQERFPSIPRFVARWARRNHCADVPAESTIATDVRRRLYTQCAGDASVVLYTIEGGGHTWPGGLQFPEAWVGSTNRSIDASSEMWEFFKAHPLRPLAARSTDAAR